MIKPSTHMMATMTTHARTPLCVEPVVVVEDVWAVVSGEGSSDVVCGCDAPLLALHDGVSSGL